MKLEGGRKRSAIIRRLVEAEMAAPIAIGVLLDYWLGWQPWCTVAGACLGLVAGLFLLVRMAKDGLIEPGATTINYSELENMIGKGETAAWSDSRSARPSARCTVAVRDGLAFNIPGGFWTRRGPGSRWQARRAIARGTAVSNRRDGQRIGAGTATRISI